eukprot:scaffold139489_cov18-Prasinocladus_malaysianus.AAC.1
MNDEDEAWRSIARFVGPVWLVVSHTSGPPRAFHCLPEDTIRFHLKPKTPTNSMCAGGVITNYPMCVTDGLTD